MNALRWAGMACRAIALLLLTLTVLAAVRVLDRHELRIELRPMQHPIERGPAWI